MNTLAQGLCLCHESCGHFVMNTMMLDVQILTSFGHWNYMKEKIIQHNSTTKNLTSWAKNWDAAMSDEACLGEWKDIHP